MTERRDVIVAGAGPAGLALALELCRAPTLSVAIVDSARPPRMRLGETLSPDARPMLAHLGVDAFAAGDHAPCQGVIAVWGSDDTHYNDFLYHPTGHGWRLDRERFDATLAAEARRRGAIRIEGRIGSVVRQNDEWQATIGEVTTSARVIADAAGRQSPIARRLGAKRVVADSLVGIAGVFKSTNARVEERWALIEARRDGWGYSAVLPDGRIAVVAMTDSDLAHAERLHEADPWRAWIESLPRIRERIAGATLVEGPAVASSSSDRLDHIAGDGWLAVGDAATAFDPLSFHGISKALRSGIRAAKAIREWLQGETRAFEAYADAEAATYAAYLSARRDYYTMERRWREEPFWKRRSPTL
ncbi:MAG TPA: NAD(P)/FAD-dependent oxidoreductase [Thermoanaerobaculia bacterium]|jgi:flavin-dependent dehydrogenase